MAPPARRDDKSKRPTSRFISIPRDSLLFLGGLLGVMHETLFTEADRPQLLLLFAAMMGLPAFLRADESRKKDDQ